MRNVSELSSRQIKILEVIRDFADEYGYPPTVRQIGEAVGISSTSVVSYNLAILQRKGYLARDREVSRGLRLVTGGEVVGTDLVEIGPVIPAAAWSTIPLLGTIAAGEPIPIPDSDFAPANYEQIAVTPDIVRDTTETYALRVRGTSMIDALISDGDIVIIRHQETAENGEAVVAWLKEEKATTLKRVYQEVGQPMVRLVPANPTMQPFEVDASNLEIQGKVVAIIRRMD
jgi:repressor LexA